MKDPLKENENWRKARASSLASLGEHLSIQSFIIYNIGAQAGLQKLFFSYVACSLLVLCFYSAPSEAERSRFI
jgi:hypothetical protein